MTKITRTEYIGDINGATAFTIQKTFIINPGNIQLNPWLQPIANQYEQYKYKYLRFRYKPVISDTTAGLLALGTISMGFDPNVTNPAWTSKAEFLQFQGSVDVRPSRELVYNVNNINRFDNYLVNNNASMSGFQAGNTYYQDPKTIWPGVFYIACANNSVTTQLGELYVDYEIELIKAKIGSPYGTGLMVSAYSTLKNGNFPFNTNASGTNKYRTNGILNIIIDNAQVYLQPGWPVNVAFRVIFNIKGTGLVFFAGPNNGPGVTFVTDEETDVNGNYTSSTTGVTSAPTNGIYISSYVCTTAPTTTTSTYFTLPALNGITTITSATVNIFIYESKYSS